MTDRLSPEARNALVRYARSVLRAHTAGALDPPAPEGDELHAIGSVFVTLRRPDGELRGCIGETRFTRSLLEGVAAMTKAAASDDPRFPAVTADEAEDLQLEVSRLTTPVPGSVDDLEIGRHGIVVSRGGRRGLLLPQVAVEFECDPRAFVELACRKAGLPEMYATNDDLDILLFEAEVFGE